MKTGVPPIVITEHARERLEERLRVHPKKVARLVEKAWRSTNHFSKQQQRREYTQQYHPMKNRVVRELMGHLLSVLGCS